MAKQIFSKQDLGWIALGLLPGMGPRQKFCLLKTFQTDPLALMKWAKQAGKVQESENRRNAGLIQQKCRALSLDAAQAEVEEVRRLGGIVVPYSQPLFPGCLRHLVDPPCFVEVLGENWPRIQTRLADSLGVVGARRCSAYGLMAVTRLVKPLARHYIMISGGAYGIDIAAHEVTLAAGGTTVAVLGSGLAKPYPPNHAGIFRKIAENGVLVSEFGCLQGPRPHQFPQRNRIIAGFSAGILVVEAGERSGARITAQLALDQGKEVMAVPGPINQEQSRGTHRLIQEGAYLVRTPLDIIQCMGWDWSEGKREELSMEQQRFLQAMGWAAISRQGLMDHLKLEPEVLSRWLCELIKRQWIEPVSGDRFIRLR